MCLTTITQVNVIVRHVPVCPVFTHREVFKQTVTGGARTVRVRIVSREELGEVTTKPIDVIVLCPIHVVDT